MQEGVRISVFAIVAVAMGSTALAQNSEQATPNPRNLGEAAGLYAGAVALVEVVKESRCGYAIPRQIVTLPQAIRSDISPLFPRGQQTEVVKVLSELEPDMVHQGRATFDAHYAHYTKVDRLDHNTACGFVAGMAISVRKLTHEAMVRLAPR